MIRRANGYQPKQPNKDTSQEPRNVLGQPLLPCCFDPMTGFYRDGHCNTGPQDEGAHTVCAQMTEEFLAFSVAKGNDLVTPRPDWGFPGLKPGDFWCLCALRWLEAFEAGVGPPVKLSATHEATLKFVDIEYLKSHALEE